MINKRENVEQIFNTNKTFQLQSLIHSYRDIICTYTDSDSNTKNKIIRKPKINAALMTKSSYMTAIDKIDLPTK